MINFIILIGIFFINKSRNNRDPLYFIKFLPILKEKIECINYIKQNNDEDLTDLEKDVAGAL